MSNEAAIEVLDAGLVQTIERNIITSDEVRDILLDVRQALVRETQEQVTDD